MGALEARYADALLSVATTPQEADWMDMALTSFAETLSENAELGQFLLNPVTPSGARKSAVRGCVTSGLVTTEPLLAVAARGGNAMPEQKAAPMGSYAGSAQKAAPMGSYAGPTQKPAPKGSYAGPAQKPAPKGGKAEKTLADFLCLLIDKGRLPVVAGIAREYHDAKSRNRNILRVTVSAVDPLGAGQLDAIKRKYQKQYGASAVELDFRADPTLVGGIRVQIGDVRIEDTLSGRLAALREAISLQGDEALGRNIRGV